MTEKETAEIRRRFRPDKSNITFLRGCYVNEKREVISEFHQPLSSMQEQERENFLTLIKRTLSGTQGRNLIDITFATQQVADSEEHSLLMKLRDSGLDDDEAVHLFFQKAIGSINMEGDYLIFLACESYDVPTRKMQDILEDDSPNVFSYFVCSVCPVKMSKPVLSYNHTQNEFHNCNINWLVSPPELGFMFPSFDDRTANIYNALFYTHGSSENHQEFIDTVFHTEIPMAADEQKETFNSILREALDDDCSLGVIQAVHDQICEMMEDHKSSKEEEPLTVSKQAVKNVLSSCGVAEAHVDAFEEKFNQEFGADTDLTPQNLINVKRFEVCTPDVTIQVKPERKDLVETRTIDGIKYILIRADEGVEVNGVDIHIS